MAGAIGLQPPMAEWKHVKSKICLVGDFAVGKTSLVRRFTQDVFSDLYLVTLGTKVSKKSLRLETADRVVDVDIIVWDIMGQPRFRDVLKDAYFSEAKGVLAVCDVTRMETLEDLPRWVRAVEGVSGPVPVVIAVNKADRTAEAQFGEHEARAVADRLEASLYLTSAKSGANVEEAFRELGNRIVGAHGK